MGSALVYVSSATVNHGVVTPERLGQMARELDAPGGGFTFDAVTGQAVRTGFALSVFPERERQIGDRVTGADVLEFIRDNKDLLLSRESGAVVGGWRDTAEGGIPGIAFLDVSIVVQDAARAAELGRAFGQLAYFDLTNGVEVRLDVAEAA